MSFLAQMPPGADAVSQLGPILIRPVDESGRDPLHRRAQRTSFLGADEQTPLATNPPEWTARLCKFAVRVKNALQKLRRGCKPVFLGKAPDTEKAQWTRA
jgi:hypothetical protein